MTQRNPDPYKTLPQKIAPDQLFKHMADNMNVNAGQGRYNNIVLVSAILATMGLPFADPDTNQPYAYCSSGVAFYTAMTYVNFNPTCFPKVTNTNRVQVYKSALPYIDKYYFKPSASCTVTIEDAKKRGIWVPKSNLPKDFQIPKGWLAYYQFTPTDRHVGVVYYDESGGGSWQDIECNVSSSSRTGMIALKTRDLQYLLGFVKTYPISLAYQDQKKAI